MGAWSAMKGKHLSVEERKAAAKELVLKLREVTLAYGDTFRQRAVCPGCYVKAESAALMTLLAEDLGLILLWDAEPDPAHQADLLQVYIGALQEATRVALKHQIARGKTRGACTVH